MHFWVHLSQFFNNKTRENAEEPSRKEIPLKFYLHNITLSDDMNRTLYDMLGCIGKSVPPQSQALGKL
jgi:hypothetical protein